MPMDRRSVISLAAHRRDGHRPAVWGGDSSRRDESMTDWEDFNICYDHTGIFQSQP